jgi:hypothetical protein
MVPVLLIHNVFVQDFKSGAFLTMDCLSYGFLADFMQALGIEDGTFVILLRSCQLYGHCF